MSCRDPGCIGWMLDEGGFDNDVPGPISERFSGVLFKFESRPEGRGSLPFLSSVPTFIEVGPKPAGLHGDVVDPLPFRSPGGVGALTPSILRSAAELSAWNQAYRLTPPVCGVVQRQAQERPPFQADGPSTGAAP